jgi:putative CRISPR-associated protein (TIGR02619 family)
MKVKYVHVVTVGSSLATNYSMKNEREVDHELGKMNLAQRKRYVKALYDFLKERGPSASAEASSMSEFLRSGEISLAYLLHTDTPSGRCCAEALGMFLEENGVESRTIEVKGYTGGPETFQLGLSNLVMEISKILASHDRVRICATGGYKPESAIASILGFIAGAPVYYIHATFDRVVHLPSLPLDWRYELKKHRRAVEELLVRESILQEEFVQRYGREAADDLLAMWLIEKRDKTYVLTEVGRTLLGAVKLLMSSKRK